MRFSKKHKKQLITLLIAFIVFGIGFLTEALGFNDFSNDQQPTILSPGTYEVVNIEDGDTLTVNMNGTEERVRFIGVDTPEIRDPRKPVQCFGRAASQFTKNLIGDSAVRLEADPENTNRDRYNRLLRYIYLPEGTLVNAEIIRQGYGFAYTSFPFTKKEEFKELENQARQQNLGLWGDCQTGFDENGYRTINPDPNP
ncbi:thermonuclease family protein [Candidatus Saccharibacteria bacterium]|nr:thermonuclease family protein [Candidatus Saccharibacteria bacterium]